MFLSICIYYWENMQDLLRLIAYLVRPQWNVHTEHARSVRAPRAMERFYEQAAAGDFFKVLEESCAALQNVELLERIGFIMDFHQHAPGGMGTDDSLVVAQDDKAMTAWDLVRNLCRQRVGSMLWHCAHWPG